MRVSIRPVSTDIVGENERLGDDGKFNRNLEEAEKSLRSR